MQTVLVTGISGFLAKHIAVLLLKSGYRVRGTVRSMAKEGDIRALARKHGFPDDQLELIIADLSQDDGWADAVRDCSFVQHVASPFPLERPADKMALVPEAKGGTLRVLAAAQKAGVKRVVLTSSTVSVTQGATHPNGYAFSEDDWSDVESPIIDSYSVSKTLAEKAAWDFVKGSEMELAVMNPGFICGPTLDADIGSSGKLIQQFMTGKYPAAPALMFSIVDARDVAEAHVVAMLKPEAAGKRFVLSGGTMLMMGIAGTLKSAFPKYAGKLPKFTAPKLMLAIFALFDPAVRGIKHEVGKVYSMNTQRAEDILGLKFRKPAESVTAMGQSLIDLELV